LNAFTPGARRAVTGIGTGARTKERAAVQACAAARRAGQPTYQGQPCAHGHRGRRYTSDQHCVECRAERTDYGLALRRNTLLAALYPQEFDAMGWHRLAAEEGV
jgi:hypothetical protein